MEGIVDCATIEANNHIKYISDTPVAWSSQLLASKQAKLKRAVIKSREELGNMKTIFGDLGGIKSKNENSSGKFLVCQVLETLEKKDCQDKKSLESVRYFMEQERRGELKPTVTILRNNGELMVIDGDKRAAAIYEVNKETDNEEISLKVYILDVGE